MLTYLQMGLCMSIILYFALRRENARRDRVYGPVDDPAVSFGPDGEKRRDVPDDVESEKYLQRWGLEGKTRDEIIDLGDDVSRNWDKVEIGADTSPIYEAPCVPIHSVREMGPWRLGNERDGTGPWTRKQKPTVFG